MDSLLNDKKLIIFDLDDTLILERDYVISGLHFIARFFSENSGVNERDAATFLLDTFENSGRERIFNKLFDRFSISYNESDIQSLVCAYRHHRPALELPDESLGFLKMLRSREVKLAIVTDGLEIMQANKVEALGLDSLVDVIVYCWAVEAPKPATKGFEIAMLKSGCSPEETVIIGDNPGHDIKAAGLLGVDSLRVHTGRYAMLPDLEGFAATKHFESLQQIFG